MRHKHIIRLIAGITIGIVTLAVPLIAWRWWWHQLATTSKGTTPRLQYIFVASRDMERGHQVTAQDLEFRVFRRPDGEDLIQIPADIIGSFVIADHIAQDHVLDKGQFQAIPAIKIPVGGAVVPVEVSQSHIGGLRPGMRLVFVNDKGMTPTKQDLARKKPEPTFLLVSIAIPPQDKSTASLLVEVEKCRMPLVKMIGNGTWRPIIVQNGK